jgi:hypothetical protein
MLCIWLGNARSLILSKRFESGEADGVGRVLIFGAVNIREARQQAREVLEAAAADLHSCPFSTYVDFDITAHFPFFDSDRIRIE